MCCSELCSDKVCVSAWYLSCICVCVCVCVFWGVQMCDLLEGRYSCLVESFLVVDCRYPYEYQGGHIKVRDCVCGSVYNTDSERERVCVRVFVYEGMGESE